jgi:hypothetical protein
LTVFFKKRKQNLRRGFKESLKMIEEARNLYEKAIVTFKDDVLKYINNFIKMIEGSNLKEGGYEYIDSKKLTSDNNDLVDWDTFKDLIQKFFKVPITMNKLNTLTIHVDTTYQLEKLKKLFNERMLKNY